MAATFESLLHPFIVMFTIPLALVGAVLANHSIPLALLTVIALYAALTLALGLILALPARKFAPVPRRWLAGAAGPRGEAGSGPGRAMACSVGSPWAAKWR